MKSFIGFLLMVPSVLFAAPNPAFICSVNHGGRQVLETFRVEPQIGEEHRQVNSNLGLVCQAIEQRGAYPGVLSCSFYSLPEKTALTTASLRPRSERDGSLLLSVNVLTAANEVNNGLYDLMCTQH